MRSSHKSLTFGSIAKAIDVLSGQTATAADRTKAEALLKNIKLDDALARMQQNPAEARAAADEKSRLIRAANLSHTDG